jgi:hypothetical protein
MAARYRRTGWGARDRSRRRGASSHPREDEMSFQSFLNDPKTYLVHHEMQVAANLTAVGTLQNGVRNALVSHGHHVASVMRGNQYCTMQRLMAAPVLGRMDTVLRPVRHVGRALGASPRLPVTYGVVANGANDVGFRWLPWDAQHIYTTWIDAAASLWMTGPINGCTVAAVRHNGLLLALHANRNGGGVPACVATQDLMIDEVCNGLGINPANVVRCRYTQQYHGNGFAFGRRRGNVWKMYVHYVNPQPGGGNQVATVKWGEL